jgi:hypothetical protein
MLIGYQYLFKEKDVGDVGKAATWLRWAITKIWDLENDKKEESTTTHHLYPSFVGQSVEDDIPGLVGFFVFINVFKMKCKLQLSNTLWQKFKKTFILNWVKTETELKFFFCLKKTRWQVTNENHFSVDDIRDLFLNFFCLTNFPSVQALFNPLFVSLLNLALLKIIAASEKNKR